MYILFNDVIQYSNASDSLKSPMLSDITNINNTLTITFDSTRNINCIGIGNTNGTIFTVNSQQVNFTENGLYLLNNQSVNQITITTNATYIGRLATGQAVNIPTSIAKEPAYNSTSEPRVTLSGQIIQGKGGYNYRSISLDSRYKINETIMNEIKNGYKYIGKGYPFFIDLTDESYKLPFNKLYAIDNAQQNLSFESGVKKYLYSRRWNFRECF